MRVLHTPADIAGVPALLVKGLRQRGVKADLITCKRHRYGFPHETVVNVPTPVFLFHIIKLSQDYDIVHTHALSYRTLFNIDIFALKTLKARLLIHLHGTEIRESHNNLSTKAALQICNQVLVATPDLLSYYPKATLLPTPIDPVFKPLKNPQRYGKALYFRKWYEPEMVKVVQMKCDDMGLELMVQYEPILYSEMPTFLNQFEVFFDRFTIPSLSKTALEALACGCKVVSWKGLVTDHGRILKSHSLKNVTEKLLRIYQEVLS